jgi:hypothetical protein
LTVAAGAQAWATDPGCMAGRLSLTMLDNRIEPFVGGIGR